MKTRQEKEQYIVGTILNCNKEIKNCFSNKKIMIPLLEKTNIYHFNMLQLFSNIVDTNLQNLNESEVFNFNLIKNVRNNYYSYFNKVNEFLLGFEQPLMHSLNESLNVDQLRTKNATQINIFSFKEDLKNIIEILEKENEIDSIPDNILKIKLQLAKPISIHGYNIVNNFGLQNEIQSIFGPTFIPSNLFSIFFNKSDKQLLFLYQNKKIICYDLKKDLLDFYEKINNSEINLEFLDIKNYFSIIREQINNNIIEIYFNFSTNSLIQIKFDDNLYSDRKRTEQINNQIKNSFIKF